MQRIAISLFACLIAVVIATPASAVQLRYKWKKGATYRFDAESQDAVKMGGMGMNIDTRFNTSTRFALKIAKVRPNGVAEGTLTIEKFKVTSSDGRTMAGLDSVPKNALKNPVEIDAKGNFRFKKIVYLVVDEESGANVLVSGSAGPNSVTATGQAGDEQVTVYAQFDPKTGKLSGGYSVKKVGKKKKKIAVKQDAQRVDILPIQFLELLKLPEGDATGGASLETNVAQVKVAVTAEELTAARAKLRVRVSTNVDTAAVADEDAGAGGMAGMGAMGGMTGMGGMAGMGAVPGMDAESAAATSAGSAQVKADGDFVVDFDVAKGIMDGIAGTMSTSTTAGGMVKIDSTSQLKMTRVK